MTIQITFVRHGETDANAASIWQGQGEAALSETGVEQARALRRRLESVEFDRILTSDLVRTMQTADLAGLDAEPDPAWREMDIGVWEGLTRAEVHARYGDQVGRIASGDQDIKMGGGESWGEFSARVMTAVERLIAETTPGSRVLVMAHGGVIHAVLAWGLGFRRRRPWPVSRILNAAITQVEVGDDGFRLGFLNDARHAPVVTGNQGDPGTPIALIRHGETMANLAGRWHGLTDGPLSERGARQGRELASRYNGVARIFSSPLERTRLTAHGFAESSGLEVELAPGLVEMNFGAWEDLTTEEIEQRFPDEFQRVFRNGEDLARGGSGETFSGAGARIERQVQDLAERHHGERLALFTHGGAIWAFSARVVGIGWDGWRRLAMPDNVSTTHVRFDGTRPILVDYNLTL